MFNLLTIISVLAPNAALRATIFKYRKLITYASATIIQKQSDIVFYLSVTYFHFPHFVWFYALPY